MKHSKLAMVVLAASFIGGCNGNATTKESAEADANAAIKEAAADHGHSSSPFDKPGYVAEVHDGRLWVFLAGSRDYADFKRVGEPAKIVTRIGAGPNGMTMRSTEADVIDGYLLSTPGYVAEVHDGRLWVFLAGSQDFADFKQHGEPAKIVTRIGAGPNGMTMRSTEADVIDGYLATSE